SISLNPDSILDTWKKLGDAVSANAGTGGPID
ncbi:MAG: hypothetical protein RL748_466, partial [Pseudomonadota bacterium]